MVLFAVGGYPASKAFIDDLGMMAPSGPLQCALHPTDEEETLLMAMLIVIRTHRMPWDNMDGEPPEGATQHGREQQVASTLPHGWA